MAIDLNINPTQQHISDFVQIGDKIIHRYDICSTSIVSYVVYEKSDLFGKHSSITHIPEQGGWLGDMTTRALPEELEAMRSGSDERIQAVCAYLADLKQQALALIHGAFPRDFLGVNA